MIASSAEAQDDLVASVRPACAWVAENARHVRIREGEPERYATRFAESIGNGPTVEWDVSTHYRGDTEETVAYVITLDAINFGSGYFPHLAKRPGMSGYFTVATALKERFESSGPLPAPELRRLEPADTAALLHQPPGDPVRDELVGLFTAALRDLGTFLEDRFEGSFSRLVSSAGSARELAASLVSMPFFRDVAIYRGREIPLLKRAQITPSDLTLALDGLPPARYEDLDELTIFADNLVPHVLRVDGVLEYSPDLAARLEQGEPLPAGSEEEVEIRAVALHAVELMKDALRAHGLPATARELDLLLWNRGQAPAYRGGSKHRTRTVYY